MTVDVGEKSLSSLHEHAEAPLDVAVPAVRGKAERRLVWKQDLIILPLLAFSFFFAYVVSGAAFQNSAQLAIEGALLIFWLVSCRIAGKLEMPACWGFRRTLISVQMNITTHCWFSVSDGIP